MSREDSATDDIPSLRSRNVAGVVATLRELMLARHLLPGEQIRQEDMARTLGISRVPLREALRVLTAEGLLTHKTNQGYRVAKLSHEDLDQIYVLLEFLETELIRTVRWPAAEEVDDLRRLNKDMDTAAAAGDVTTMNRLNRDLHVGIFRLSPLTLLLAEAERFWTLSEPYRILHVATTDPAVAIEQHDQLIDALAARNRALCLRLLTKHRNDTQTAVLDLLGRSGPPARHVVAG